MSKQREGRWSQNIRDSKAMRGFVGPKDIFRNPEAGRKSWRVLQDLQKSLRCWGGAELMTWSLWSLRRSSASLSQALEQEPSKQELADVESCWMRLRQERARIILILPLARLSAAMPLLDSLATWHFAKPRQQGSMGSWTKPFQPHPVSQWRWFCRTLTEVGSALTLQVCRFFGPTPDQSQPSSLCLGICQQQDSSGNFSQQLLFCARLCWKVSHILTDSLIWMESG